MQQCNTKVFEIADIDDHSNNQGVLQMQMAGHQTLSLAMVISCYMPNEEEILPEVLGFYEQQLQHYPGESKVLIMWNSPKTHPEFEKLLAEKASSTAWSGRLVVRRCMHSTSKRDNLNMACDLIGSR